MKTITLKVAQPRTGMPATKTVTRHLIIFSGQGDGDTPSLLTWREYNSLDDDTCDYTYVCRVVVKIPNILWGTHSEIWSDITDLAVLEAKKLGLLKEEIILGTSFYRTLN